MLQRRFVRERVSRLVETGRDWRRVAARHHIVDPEARSLMQHLVVDRFAEEHVYDGVPWRQVAEIFDLDDSGVGDRLQDLAIDYHAPALLKKGYTCDQIVGDLGGLELSGRIQLERLCVEMVAGDWVRDRATCDFVAMTYRIDTQEGRLALEQCAISGLAGQRVWRGEPWYVVARQHTVRCDEMIEALRAHTLNDTIIACVQAGISCRKIADELALQGGNTELELQLISASGPGLERVSRGEDWRVVAQDLGIDLPEARSQLVPPIYRDRRFDASNHRKLA
ncbi:hypothetical protein [Pararobbsia silviterrae]|nr:hypothetical protein [Pararobbsia silviterrae]